MRIPLCISGYFRARFHIPRRAELALFTCVLIYSTSLGNPSLRDVEKVRILSKAEPYLTLEPITITASTCQRSNGGFHDFYSEGDYWWPDPTDPDGPYVRRDGESNPDAFLDHRKSMLRLAEITASLTSAWLINGDSRYSTAAMSHIEAWFVDKTTRMNPNLRYAQAIPGVSSGRSIGIIDTLHLIEVARSIKALRQNAEIDPSRFEPVLQWFREYLFWLNTDPMALIEKKHPNNHGVCWSLQAATFADLVGDTETMDWVRQEFIDTYLSKMMADDGSFPAELARTKPYGYSLFVADAMAGIAQLLSTPNQNLWTFKTPEGHSMRLAFDFIVPYIKDKTTWPMDPDIQNWDAWPVRHCLLIFGGMAYRDPEVISTWLRLEADPEYFETVRNFPIRHPLLWVTDPEKICLNF